MKKYLVEVEKIITYHVTAEGEIAQQVWAEVEQQIHEGMFDAGEPCEEEEEWEELRIRSVTEIAAPHTPRQLPIVALAGKQYYRDDRLQEYRAIDDPNDVIPF